MKLKLIQMIDTEINALILYQNVYSYYSTYFYSISDEFGSFPLSKIKIVLSNPLIRFKRKCAFNYEFVFVQTRY